MRYKIILEKDEEGGYSVYVPALRGVLLRTRHLKKQLKTPGKQLKVSLKHLRHIISQYQKMKNLFTEVAVPMPLEYLLKVNALAVEANY